MTEQIHWLAEQPSQVGLLLGRSEVLRSSKHYITLSVTWRSEAWKEEALDDLRQKYEKGPSSVRRTLKPFEWQL